MNRNRKRLCYILNTLNRNKTNYNPKMLQNILVPIIEKKLYLLAATNPPKDLFNAFYFNIDKDLAYEPFYEDFGPISIGTIWQYINEVHKILSNPEYQAKVFYHHTSPDYKKCCNSVLLICSYQIVMMGKSAQQAYKPFECFDFKPFRDASYGKCSYKCTILECLAGLQYAMKLGWFSFKSFNLTEYQHHSELENGDLHWVVPGKLIAFSSPYDASQDQYGNQLLSPKQYVSIFKKLGVKAVIRLNMPTYDKQKFVQYGIEHHDLYFTDGTAPPPEIVNRFLQIVESVDGAVAVHCKAGLGRTGCLIACYAMKHYKFSAAALIGWIRLCRPGSILGPQQHFLIENQELMHKYSESSQIWMRVSQKMDQKELQKVHKSMKKISTKNNANMNEQELSIFHKGEAGQGSRLVKAKKNHCQTKQKMPTE